MKEVALIDTKSYWDAVIRTGVAVFHAPRDQVQRLADKYAAEMSGWPESERLLFFNDEPVYVAADLLGVAPTETHLEAYIALKRETNPRR